MAGEISDEKVVLQNLLKIRDKGSYADVVVTVAGIQYSCHKVILAATSDYFGELFNSKYSDTEAPNISSLEVTAVFQNVLSYMYTGKTEITLKNAYNLLVASDYLQMKELKGHCMKFIEENPQVEDGLKILNFAISPAGSSEFVKIAAKNVADSFSKIILTDDFLKMDFMMLESILLRIPRGKMICPNCNIFMINYEYQCSSYKRCDKCCTKSSMSNQRCHICWTPSSMLKEDILFSRISDWIMYDVVERLQYFPKLTKYANLDEKYVNKWQSLISEYTAKVTFQQSIHIYVWTDAEHPLVNFIYDNDDGSWKVFENLKLTFTCVKGLAVGEKLYFLSSEWFEKRIVNKFWVDEKQGQWRELQSPPVFGKNYEMACISSTIYLYMSDKNPVRKYTALSHVNFEEEIGSRNIYIYVVDLNKWFTLPPIPRFLFNSYFVAANDELFVIGGSTSLPVEHDTVVKITQSFDPRTSQWSEREFDLDLNFKGRACSYGSEIFICEMRNGDTIKVFIYDVISKNWETTMMHDKGIFSVDAVAVHGSHLWIVLSTDVGCSVKTYHLKTKVWNSLPCIPSSVKVDGVDCRVFGIFDALVF